MPNPAPEVSRAMSLRMLRGMRIMFMDGPWFTWVTSTSRKLMGQKIGKTVLANNMVKNPTNPTMVSFLRKNSRKMVRMGLCTCSSSMMFPLLTREPNSIPISKPKKEVLFVFLFSVSFMRFTPNLF
jgi:hypothetical protein